MKLISALLRPIRVATATWCLALPVLAQVTIPPTTSNPGFLTSPPNGPFPTGPGQSQISIGSPSSPISLVPVTQGFGWTKLLTINLSDTDGMAPGQTVHLTEYITLTSVLDVPPLTITDWHELINPGFGNGADFEWKLGTIIDLATGQPLPGLTTSLSDDGRGANFFFSPITGSFDAPITLCIDKDLVYTGDSVLTSGPGSLQLAVAEMPTVPEPATWTIFAGAGLAGFAAWRTVRRRA